MSTEKTTQNQPVGLLTEREAAEFLGIAPGTLRVSRSTGPMDGRIFIPYVKMGRSVRYDFEVLKRYLEEHTITEKES